MGPPKLVKGEEEWTKAGGTVQRKEYQSGRVETYYISPSGKRLRSWAECERFMQGLSPRKKTPSKKQKPGDYSEVVSVEVHTSPTVANGEEEPNANQDSATESTPMVEESLAAPSGEPSLSQQKDLAPESPPIVDSTAGPSGDHSSKAHREATLCTPKEEYPGGQLFPYAGFNSPTEYTPSVELHQPVAPDGGGAPADDQNATELTPGGQRPMNAQRWAELGGRVEKMRRKDGRIRCLYVAANGKKFRTWKECERFLQGSSTEGTPNVEQSPLAEQPPAATPDGEVPFTGYNNGTEFITPVKAHDSTVPGVQESLRGYEIGTESTPSEAHQPTVPGGEASFPSDFPNATDFTPSEENPPAVLSGKDPLTGHRKSQRWIELGVRVERKKRKHGVGYRYMYVAASGRKFPTLKECEKFLQVSCTDSTVGVVHSSDAGPTASVSFTGYNNATECTPEEAHQPPDLTREQPVMDYNTTPERTPGKEHVEHVPVFSSRKESLTSHEKAQRWTELGGRVEQKRRTDGKLRCLYITPTGKKFRTWKECEKFLQGNSNECTPSVVQPPPSVPGGDDSFRGYHSATGFSPGYEQQAAGPSGEVPFTGNKIATEYTPSEEHQSTGTGRENITTGHNEGTEFTLSGEQPSAVPTGRYENRGIRVERKKRPRGGYRYSYVTASGKKFHTLKECEKFLQGSSTEPMPGVTPPPITAASGEALFQGDKDAEAFASSKEQQAGRPSGGVSFTDYDNPLECTPKEEETLPGSGNDATDEDNARRWVGFGGRVEKKTYKNGRVCWFFVASNGKKFRTWEECEKFLQGGSNESTPSVEPPPPAAPAAKDSFPGYINVPECPPSAEHQHTPSGGEDLLKGQANPTECTTNEEHRPAPPSGDDSFAGDKKAERWIQRGGTVERIKYKDGKVRLLYIAPNGKKFRSWRDCERVLHGSFAYYSPSLRLNPPPAEPVGESSFAGYHNASVCTPSEHPPVVTSGSIPITGNEVPAECTPSKEPPPAGPSGEGHGAAMEDRPSDELPPAGPNQEDSLTSDNNSERWIKLGGSVEKKQRKSGRVAVFYVAPNGEKFRSWRECERFMQETPQTSGGGGKALENGTEPPSTPPPSRTDAPVSSNGEDSGKGPKGGQQWIALGGSVEKKVYSSGRVEFFYVTSGGKKLRSWKDCERWLQTTSPGGHPPAVTVGPSSV